VTIDATSQGDIQMDSSPTNSSSVPTGTSMISTFGTDSTALRAGMIFGSQLLRDTAIAEVTGIAWGSP
jgi:hypothetical protein